jgi:hypothetical protein
VEEEMLSCKEWGEELTMIMMKSIFSNHHKDKGIIRIINIKHQVQEMESKINLPAHQALQHLTLAVITRDRGEVMYHLADRESESGEANEIVYKY